MEVNERQASKVEPRQLKQVGLWELVGYFLRLGAFGFGGPIALAGYMQRDLIPRGWITEQEYLEGLAFSQMMPGPLAAQLAMWIGYIRHGAVGASLVGIVFILPAFVIVLAISFLYVAFQGLAIVQALFYGIGPVVIAIVAYSAVRLAKATVGTERRMWLIFGIVALITLVSRAEIALLFVVSGFIGILLYTPPGSWKKQARLVPGILAPVAGVSATAPLLWKLAG